MNYFLIVLKQEEVVYFLKHGKLSFEIMSYSLICLLPALGKFVEKLFVVRLEFFSNMIICYIQGNLCL